MLQSYDLNPDLTFEYGFFFDTIIFAFSYGVPLSNSRIIIFFFLLFFSLGFCQDELAELDPGTSKF